MTGGFLSFRIFHAGLGISYSRRVRSKSPASRETLTAREHARARRSSPNVIFVPRVIPAEDGEAISKKGESGRKKK